jgi:hypothetical protein
MDLLRFWPRTPENGFRGGRLSRRRGGLPDGRNSHQVQLVVNIGGRRQVAHRGLEGLVAHPMLHGPYIEPRAQHSRGISRTKCLLRYLKASGVADEYV